MSHQHNLAVVYRSGGEGGMDVVRWCSECGAVVVDHDVDGRVYPGHVTAMRFPTMLDRATANGAAGQKEQST